MSWSRKIGKGNVVRAETEGRRKVVNQKEERIRWTRTIKTLKKYWKSMEEKCVLLQLCFCCRWRWSDKTKSLFKWQLCAALESCVGNSCCYVWTRVSPTAGYIYMQHNTAGVIARAMGAKTFAVVTFLLSAVLLAQCEYGPRIEIAYNLYLRAAEVLCRSRIYCC